MLGGPDPIMFFVVFGTATIRADTIVTPGKHPRTFTPLTRSHKVAKGPLIVFISSNETSVFSNNDRNS